ncbi:MAG: discoidin domain-containing protein [Planctomycetes bacterium]|nr:discoidin domain-containing protein [Planctomycetota bacterium]
MKLSTAVSKFLQDVCTVLAHAIWAVGAHFCLAVTAVSTPSQVAQADVDLALHHGGQWLLDRVGTEVSHAPSAIGPNALAYYALLKSGVDKQHPEMLELAQLLALANPSRTYDLSCLILALATEDPVKHWDKIFQLAQKLVSGQNSSGDWGYPGGADLSNTQYAALGLWKASQLGVPIYPQIWRRLAERTLLYQTEEHSFGYSFASSSGSASMTAAGAGILAICEQQLRMAGKLNQDLAERMIPSRQQAQDWLGQNLREPVAGTSWHYYYLYGLERLGALTGTTHFDNQNWYHMGATKLLATQGQGSWANDNIKTSFALLFLARATSSAPGATAFTGEVDFKPEDAKAWCSLRGEGPGPLEISVAWWNRPKLRPYEWPQERGLGPRVAWVEFLADGNPIAVQLCDGSRPLGNQYFPFIHHFQRKGAKKITAQFHLNLPPNADDLLAVIQSPPMLSLVQHSLPVAMHAQPMLYGPRLNASHVSTITASSKAGRRDGLPKMAIDAKLTVDGDPNTGWIFRPNDDRRWLKIKLNQSKLIHAVQILPFEHSLAQQCNLNELGVIELRLNGKEVQPLLMPKNGKAGTLELDPYLELRSLEIRVLTTSAMPLSEGVDSGMAGIAEVVFYSFD